MKIRVNRALRTDAGNVCRGGTVELSDPAAKSLIKRGLAEEVDDESEEASPEGESEPKPKGKAKAPAKAKGGAAASAEPEKGD